MTYNIIKTENYLLVVDDSEIKGWYYDFYINKVKHSGGAEYAENSITKNIIAHLPLNNSSILDGVHLLPPPLQNDNFEGLISEHCNKNIANLLIKGYNKAKEKYKYTEEDLRKMFSRAWELRERYKNLDYDKREEFFFQKELKSLSKYPIGFECEMEYDCCGRYQNCKGCDATFDMINVRLKTTSNPQGQTTWMGNYIY
jgi:hypothetical protein